MNLKGGRFLVVGERKWREGGPFFLNQKFEKQLGKPRVTTIARPGWGRLLSNKKKKNTKDKKSNQWRRTRLWSKTGVISDGGGGEGAKWGERCPQKSKGYKQYVGTTDNGGGGGTGFENTMRE